MDSLTHQMLIGAAAVGLPLAWNATRRLRPQSDSQLETPEPAIDATQPDGATGESAKHTASDLARSINERPARPLSAMVETDDTKSIHAPPEEGIVYTELEQDHIRILEIVPGNAGGKDSKLGCKLRHYSMDEAKGLGYTALSYHWGKSQQTTMLTINDRSVKIASNLHCALQELSAQDYKLLWVDALCINQDKDSPEKAIQLQLMGSIFQQAKQVVAWLGAEDASSRRVMRALVQDIRRTHTGKTMPLMRMQTKYNNEDVLNFVRRPFWKRVWIIQEIAKATAVVFVCCGEQVGLQDIKYLVEEHATKIEHDSWTDFWENLHLIDEIFKIRGLQEEPAGLGLLEAVAKTDLALSSLDLDKVFGLLGLVRDQDVYFSHTGPTYGLDPKVMSLEMTRSFISKRKSLDIILANPRKRQGSDLPTWCPDYFGIQSEMLDAHFIDYLHGKGESFRLGKKSAVWSTTAGSSAKEFENCWIEENVLAVEAAKIGDVDGVMALYEGAYRTQGQALWRASSDKALGNTELIAPNFERPDKYTIFDAIARMFLLYDPKYKSFTKASLAPNLLYDPSYRVYASTKMANEDVKYVSDWLQKNADFDIHGRRLEDRAYWNWSIGGNWVKAALSRGAHVTNVKDYDHLGEQVSKIVREEMHLITLQHGQLGWADRWTKVEDEIWMLAGCSVPVVLRPHPGPHKVARYTIVGRAYIDTFMDGTKWRECQNAKFEDGEDARKRQPHRIEIV